MLRLELSIVLFTQISQNISTMTKLGKHHIMKIYLYGKIATPGHSFTVINQQKLTTVVIQLLRYRSFKK